MKYFLHSHEYQICHKIQWGKVDVVYEGKKDGDLNILVCNIMQLQLLIAFEITWQEMLNIQAILYCLSDQPYLPNSDL